MFSAISRFSAPRVSFTSFRYCKSLLTSCVMMRLGASEGIVVRLDAMEGTFPRGVVTLSLIDTDGVEGDGEGGRGTMSGSACGLTLTSLRMLHEECIRTEGGLDGCSGSLASSVYGVESNDGSVCISNSNSDGAMRKELIDTDDTVEIVDGVRLSVTVTAGKSAWTGVGEGTLGRSEIEDCVGVSSDDGGEGSV